MLLLLISFVAGMLTIMAPCVLPVLPVIIGGSITSNHKEKFRPYLIALSLAGSIIIFTLLLKLSAVFVNLSSNVLNYVSGSLVILLGIVSIFPVLWEQLMIRLNLQAASQRFLGKGEKNKSKYFNPILIGVALGPVFASCSPTYAFILASVLPHSFAPGLIYLVAYSLGLVITLLIVSLLGKKIVSRLRWAVDTRSWFRRLIGFAFVLIGVLIISGNMASLETWVANHLPFDETKLERILLQTAHKPITSTAAVIASTPPEAVSSSALNVEPTAAPEFVGLTNWINSGPLTLSQLKGKVVLVDFWTYSCINCIRSLPYVEAWYKAYQDDGFVVIGVSTPEFAFEHVPTNVEAAVKRDKITYPVALDNSDGTWDAYDNDSWPADYLIDKNGYIRYVSLGEGNYNVTEEAIQALLKIKQSLATPTSNIPISSNQTPETYLGADRQSGYSGSSNPNTNQDGSNTYTPTSLNSLQPNTWTLGGNWITRGQYITSASANSTISFNFTAKNVYVVAAIADGQVRSVKVSIKNNSGSFGADDSNGNLIISGAKLYNIVTLGTIGSDVATLSAPPGVSLYTFTFGS